MRVRTSHVSWAARFRGRGLGREEQDESSTGVNQYLLPTCAAIAAVCVAAFSAGLVAYAQQSPATSLQPPAQSAHKPPVKQKSSPQNVQAPSSAAETAQPQQAAPEQQQTLFDEQARQGSITTCGRVFGALGRGVAANSTFTAQTQWDSKAGNAHSVQSLVAINPARNGEALQRSAGVVFAAPVGLSCEGTMVRVTPSGESCQNIGAELTKQNGRTTALGDLSLTTLPSGVQVMLVPFGNACVAVTALRLAG